MLSKSGKLIKWNIFWLQNKNSIIGTKQKRSDFVRMNQRLFVAEIGKKQQLIINRQRLGRESFHLQRLDLNPCSVLFEVRTTSCLFLPSLIGLVSLTQ